MVEDNPGVRFPPPIPFVLAIAAGAILRRDVPPSIGGGAVRVIAAWALVAACAVLLAAGFQSFWIRHTSVVPVRPATTLVVAGPSRFTRNPMYGGFDPAGGRRRVVARHMVGIRVPDPGGARNGSIRHRA